MEREIQELKAIAAVYRKRRRFDLAAPVLRSALEMQESLYGDDSIELAKTLYELADTLCQQRHFVEAHPLLLRAAAIWDSRELLGATDRLMFTNTMMHLQEGTSSDSPANGKGKAA